MGPGYESAGVWKTYSRDAIAALFWAAVCLAVEWLNRAVGLVRLYPSMAWAGTLLTVAVALVSMCPWQSGRWRKWAGLGAAAIGLAGFFLLDQYLPKRVL